MEKYWEKLNSIRSFPSENQYSIEDYKQQKQRYEKKLKDAIWNLNKEHLDEISDRLSTEINFDEIWVVNTSKRHWLMSIDDSG